MGYYWFNRQQLLKKAKAIKEKARNKYKNLTKEEKELKRQYSKNRYNKLKQQYKESVNRHWGLISQ